MTNNIVKKIYYRVEFRLASALSVGSGEDQYSDGDIIRDSRGVPFVPGSSLAGIYRSLLKKEDADRYFGPLKLGERRDSDAESRVAVYDAKLKSEGAAARTSIRDCVKLDEWKTSVDGSKFDFEVVEPGAVFVTYLEHNCLEDDEDICRILAAAWMQQRIRIGRKTMRGFGSVRKVNVCRREFLMPQNGKDGDLEQWLDFDMYDEKCWEGTRIGNSEQLNIGRNISVELKLRQRSGISIRRYTTKVSDGGIQPDSEQITYQSGADGTEVPFIPGTSWAGAFRHHMEKLIPGSTGDYFGVCGKKEKKKSVIRFSESLIRDASPKKLTRNAVDRFTGGVIANALFSEKMWYGGKTELAVEFPADVSREFKQALAASVVDLHMGLLSVGGLTAVGRGLFQVSEMKVNGEPVGVGREMYEELLNLLERG